MSTRPCWQSSGFVDSWTPRGCPSFLGTTVSRLTREAIEAHLGGGRPRRLLLAAGAGASGHSDISESIEQILAAEVAGSP